MKVQADTINGVYAVDELEVEELDPLDFYTALALLPDGATIAADLDDGTAAMIEHEYGIH